jgi:hypothetical protein
MLSVWGRRSFNGDVLYLRRDLAFVAEMEMPDAGGRGRGKMPENCQALSKSGVKTWPQKALFSDLPAPGHLSVQVRKARLPRHYDETTWRQMQSRFGVSRVEVGTSVAS